MLLVFALFDVVEYDVQIYADRRLLFTEAKVKVDKSLRDLINSSHHTKVDFF